MKGIVTVDDIVDVVQEEATEDIQKLGGMQALEAPYLERASGTSCASAAAGSRCSSSARCSPPAR
jgi:Mg/Co/Ni transporter MgtE